MFDHDHTLFPILLSLRVASLATLFSLLLGVPLALMLARARFAGKEVLDVILTLPLVLPPVVLGYLLLLALSRHGPVGGPLSALGVSVLFTWEAAVIASTTAAIPFVIKTCRTAFEQVDPELEATAKLLGHGRWGTFWHVTLPLARRGVLAGAVLGFARAMGEFGATLMLASYTPGRTNTVALEIYAATEAGETGRVAVLVALLLGLSAIILYVANRIGPGSEH
jgi:molybdate transport system permease protein